MIVNMHRIDNIDIKNKRVLIRVDFNVPIIDGQITSHFRIIKTLDTIKYCLDNNAKIILISHLGRPKGKDENYSLFPIYKYLKSIFSNRCVLFSNDPISDLSISTSLKMKSKDIHLLENLRFYEEEASDSSIFSERLSRHGEVYVNDAFGTSHRKHASNASILNFFNVRGIGFLLDSELKYLSNLELNSDRKIALLLGGAKVSSKLGIIKYFINKANYIIIGGAMSYTFLKAKGFDVGNSLVEENMLEDANFIIKEAKKYNTRICLPIDAVCSNKISEKSICVEKNIEFIDSDEIGLDIGKKTIDLFSQTLKNSDLIIWNGPMGVFEIPLFSRGTRKIAQIIAEYTKVKDVKSIIGGGDTASAIIDLNMELSFTHVSTGGGASLELLSGKTIELIKSWRNYE